MTISILHMSESEFSAMQICKAQRLTRFISLQFCMARIHGNGLMGEMDVESNL